MRLINPYEIKVNLDQINLIDRELKSIYRLITFSRDHLADDLLDNLMREMDDLSDLVSIKNAQLEAFDEVEQKKHQVNLKLALKYVFNEIRLQNKFHSSEQLFDLYQLIAPEYYAGNPDQFRILPASKGKYNCPSGVLVPGLVRQLLQQMKHIHNPILKAIYFHHEFLRIHPFNGLNGLVSRVAKNWILLFELYPPIYINSGPDKKLYLQTLSKSFENLQRDPNAYNSYTEAFFQQEIDRLHESVNLLKGKIFTDNHRC